MFVDAGAQVGLILELLLHLFVTRQPLIHHRVQGGHGFRVITEQVLDGLGTVFVVQRLQLFNLGEQVLQPGEVAFLVGEAELNLLALELADLVDVIDLVFVQTGLKDFAEGVTSCAAFHAGLIHHDQQRGQFVGSLNPGFLDGVHHRGDLAEAL